MATDDTQRDEQWGSATLTDAIRAVVLDDRKSLHTAMPGIVQSFDAATQTARVRPAIKRVMVDGSELQLADIECPVKFPRYGNFIITGPVAAGDEGLIHFAERSVDNWFASGGPQAPAEVRFHDLSDGFFAPGYSSRGRVPANISGDALEIRTLDGATVVRVESGAVILGARDGAQPAVLGDQLQKLLDAIQTHTHPANSGGPVVASLELTTPVGGLLPTDWDPRASKVKVR